MTNFDVVPDSGVNAGVRLYGDSMEPLPRRQTHEGERQAVIGGAPRRPAAMASNPAR